MNPPPKDTQSSFVTSLAWVLIAFSGFGVFGALIQNVMINVVMPEMLAAQQQSAPTTQAFPETWFRVMGLVFLALTGFVAYCAYAFLKRREWARRAFVAFFCLGIAWNLIFAVGFGVGFQFAEFPTSGPNAVPPGMSSVFEIMTVVFAVFAAAMAGLLFWLVKKLRSPSVKAEFNQSSLVT